MRNSGNKQIEQNTLSRDWTLVHHGRRFRVNFTESDSQALALCNREKWEVQEETENGYEELCDHVISSYTSEERR